MKGNKWLSRLTAALVAFGIAYAGVGCLATGFQMEFRSGEWESVVWILLAAAAACTVCFNCKGGWWILAALTVVTFLLVKSRMKGMETAPIGKNYSTTEETNTPGKGSVAG